MFYSHEILKSHEHGVATVWLVSTIGLRSNARKISRKAIQGVDVRKACETILQPTAPIALRLQGSLLFGLSRVYSQQCHYVLTDAERVQAHMRAFYTALGGTDNGLDPQAGKSRRKELIVEDDPEFDLRIDLPAFHFDDDGNLIAPQGSQSQASRKTSSQLSPFQPDGSLSNSNRSFQGGFDLSNSPFGGGSLLANEHFRPGTMTPAKGDDGLLQFGDEERQLQAFDDWGVVIDVEGNVMEAAEEPELPRLPVPNVEEAADPMQQDEFVHFGDQDVVMGGTAYEILSDPPIPPHLMQYHAQQQASEQQEEGAMENEVNAGQAPVRAHRQRRRPILEPDEQTKITRQELRSWNANYLDNAERASQSRHGNTITEARKNAFNLIFGRGISGVGFLNGSVPDFTHPLAHHYAGEGLQAHLLGIIIEKPDDEAELPRGRRRSASEALELEGHDAERRVRRRLSEENDQSQLQAAQRPENDDALLHFGDDDLPPAEVGRRAGSALPDSDLPWNRPSSQIPSSSIKGSKNPSRQVSASPLHRRGTITGPEIERYSDNLPAYGSDDNFAALIHSGGGGGGGDDSVSDPLLPAHHQQQPHTPSPALDLDGREFLALLSAAAQKQAQGHRSPDDNSDGKQWINFDSLYDPATHSRATAVQAFYHVLSLATKNVLKVKQDGQGGTEPFGAIRVGVAVSAADHGVAEREDEM
ncbi:hypothetical protein BT67DRAFT_454689 [Trichocladium antarcticum]|uniref:Rad21/Rec8-like protein N-terminal domain-containing protein n=1 Tax=Trichocladium antarcticum TaxID=1450529 RepID=A0AAN6ZGH2_9PEZI|nr:hypothetical protein BT67DRAFT_454689 [Trichocladium antarcticum]